MSEWRRPRQTSTLALERYLGAPPQRSSADAGWRGLLVRTFVEPARMDELLVPATPDPFVVLEIQDLLVRYCYAVDDRNWDVLRREVFTPDSIMDQTHVGGPRAGLEETIAYLDRALARTVLSQHAISTTLVAIDGDTASARTHCSCPIVVRVGGGRTQVFLQGLWYRDRLVRTPHGWRIQERTEVGYWAHDVPPGFKFSD